MLCKNGQFRVMPGTYIKMEEKVESLVIVVAAFAALPCAAVFLGTFHHGVNCARYNAAFADSFGTFVV